MTEKIRMLKMKGKMKGKKEKEFLKQKLMLHCVGVNIV